jgi:hypothetical protein
MTKIHLEGGFDLRLAGDERVFELRQIYPPLLERGRAFA